MCDTQVKLSDGAVWFAKNSDREPSEPQVVVRLPAVRGDSAATLRATHIEIPQLPDRHAVILSKPSWMWGAEMGLNEYGVAIGNEAIFSRRRSNTPALLGMDLVRLGLERGGSAAQAVEVIGGLLERHGQGGPAGYADKSFCYDNSFLIADPREAWVVETAGRDWAAKRVGAHYAISNALTLAADYQRGSATVQRERPHFAQRFDTHWLPWFARSRERRALSLSCLTATGPMHLARLAAQLRQHQAGNENPRRGSNRDVCMHASGFIRRHQTTGSMIARLTPNGNTVLFTGTSAPCLSIFRPVAFCGEFQVLTPAEREIEAPLWRRHEWLHRWALTDADLRTRLRTTRERVEKQMFDLLEESPPSADTLMRADRLAAAWHKVLWESLDALNPPQAQGFWRRLGRTDGIDITRSKA